MSNREYDIALSICKASGCEPETNYAYWIRQISYSYLLMGCVEESTNRGTCVDAIKVAYGDNVPLAEAWCAQFAFVISRLACRILGVPEYLPKTKGALDMLRKSAKVPIRIDRYPEAGAVGYRPSAGATGHIFTIIAVTSLERAWSIEGNVQNRVGLRYYDESFYSNPANDVWFIHIEDFYRSAYAGELALAFY